MTETQSTKTGHKMRCHPGKHPGMLYIVSRDRGGRDDVMRKSPIDPPVSRYMYCTLGTQPREAEVLRSGLLCRQLDSV